MQKEAALPETLFGERPTVMTPTSLGKTLLGALALFVAAAVAPGASAAPPFVIESVDMDLKSEIAAAAGDGKNVVIFFHQQGCPYCDKMRARVFPDPKVMEYYKDRFVMIESNIKGALPLVTPEGKDMTEKDYAQELRIRATPVLAFFAQDGSLALRTTGYQDTDRFIKAGEYVVGKAYADGTSFFRYLRDTEGK